MFSKVQVWLLAGCISLAAGVFAFCEIWPRIASQQMTASGPGSPAETDNGPDTNEDTPPPTPQPSVPETPLPDAYFEVTATSHTEITQTNGSQNIDANAELKYAHQKTRGGIILTIYSLYLKIYQDGALAEDTLMTRDKIVEQDGNQQTVTLFDEMPPEQQAAIAGAFATNLCKITLDADQNEFGRQIYSETGYAVVNDGNINSLRLMHGPYYKGANEWQSIKRIPMTKGLILDCPLDYTRTKGGGNDIPNWKRIHHRKTWR
jgi:hypothetical protein